MPSIERLKNYARLLVTAGVNVQKGQELVVNAPVERADFARLVVAAGYEAGAGHVTVVWNDDAITRLNYENVELDFFKTTPSWRVEQLNSLAAQGAGFLWLDGDDPAALAGIDPAKPATAAKAVSTQCKVYRHGLDFGENSWTIAGVPTEAWATTVFPDEEPAQAVEHLWTAILDVARVTDDPVGLTPMTTLSASTKVTWLTSFYSNSHMWDYIEFTLNGKQARGFVMSGVLETEATSTDAWTNE